MGQRALAGALAAVRYKAKLWQRINLNSVNERQRTVINRLLDNFEGHLTTSSTQSCRGARTARRFGIFTPCSNEASS